MPLPAFPALLVSAALLLAGAVQAAPRFVATGTQDLPYERDTLPLFGIAYPTAPSEVFVAQARIGNRATNGDYEIGLHIRQPDPNVFPTNTAPIGTTTERQFAWVSARDYAFALERIGTTVSFSLGGYSESWTNPDVADVNALSFRASAGSSTTNTTELRDMTYTRLGVPGAAPQPLRGFLGGNGVRDLALFGALDDDFRLAGNLRFTWTGTPGGSSLSVQIKALEGFAVPAPGGALLLVPALLALACARRLRAR